MRARDLDIAALKAQISEMTNRLDSSAATSAQGAAAADAAVRDVAGLTAQLRATEEHRVSIERALGLAQAQQHTLTEKVATRDAEIQQLRTSLAQERERCAGLDRLLGDLRTAPARGGTQATGLAETVSHQYAVISQLDLQLVAAQAENARMMQQLHGSESPAPEPEPAPAGQPPPAPTGSAPPSDAAS